LPIESNHKRSLRYAITYNGRVCHAVELMNFLKMKQLLPVNEVLAAVIRQKEFQAGDSYVDGNRGRCSSTSKPTTNS
jgi:hypothetical protein